MIKTFYIKQTHNFLLSTPYVVKAIIDTPRISKLTEAANTAGNYCVSNCTVSGREECQHWGMEKVIYIFKKNENINRKLTPLKLGEERKALRL